MVPAYAAADLVRFHLDQGPRVFRAGRGDVPQDHRLKAEQLVTDSRDELDELLPLLVPRS